MTKFLTYLMPFISVGFGIFVVKNAWAAILAYHFCILLILFVEKYRPSWRRLFRGGNTGMSFVSFLIGLVSGVTLYLAGTGLFSLPQDFTIKLNQFGLTGSQWMPFILYYSLVNPFMEEIYWRGYLGSATAQITWSDICYAGYHPLVILQFAPWPIAIGAFIVLVGAAWVWRYWIRKYNGMLLPFVMHTAADISIILAVYWMAVSLR